MRSGRFILLGLVAVALAGCMQSGGSGVFARNAPPLWQQNISMPAMLRPGARPVAAQPVAQPIEQSVMAGSIDAPMQIAQPVMEPEVNSYALDSGDKLRVVVFGQDGLTASYSVDTSGNITLPLIGAVRARGVGTAGLQQAIAAKLRNGYVREPHVAVEVEAYRPFFILGEVTLPGQYPYVPNMTVETAVAIAGGYTPRAYRWNAEVSRSAGGLTARQKVPTIAPVRPGDTVTVTERWF
jgi:polysaccharide export outer membrane protein